MRLKKAFFVLQLCFIAYFTLHKGLSVLADTIYTSHHLPLEPSSVASEVTPEDDNIYEGYGEGYNGTIKVAVELENNHIISIKVLRHWEDLDWYLQAKESIFPAILATQSTDVDIISGATYTSNGLIEAVEDALVKGGAKND